MHRPVGPHMPAGPALHRQVWRRQQARHERGSACRTNSSRSPCSGIFLDIDALVNTAPLTLQLALAASQCTWGTPAIGTTVLQDLAAHKERGRPCTERDVLPMLRGLDLPAHAVFLIRLLHEELKGEQERARGARRTRPLRVAEIKALWGEELMAVCLARWALGMGCSTVELQRRAVRCFNQAMTDSAERQHAAFELPVAPNQQVVNTVVAAAQQQAQHVCVLSTWPQPTTDALLDVCRLGRPAKPWAPGDADARTRRAPDVHCAVQPSWQQVLTAAAGWSGLVITANPARATQARMALADTTAGPQVVLLDPGQGGAVSRPGLHVSSSDVVDEAGLAGLLGLTDSRLVMDGVVW